MYVCMYVWITTTLSQSFKGIKPPISPQHDRVVGSCWPVKNQPELDEISRLLPLFRFCTALFTYGGSWWGTRGVTRVFPQHACLLSRTHPTNLRPSIASATQGIDFDVVIIQQALEAIDEVGDLLKVKYSRRKIDVKEWKLRQLSKERTITVISRTKWVGVTNRTTSLLKL